VSSDTFKDTSIVTLSLLGIIEVINTNARYDERSIKFKKAQELANQLNKPLVVIGAPNTGFRTRIFGANYGCGDICIDLVGCDGCKESLSLDITKSLPFKDNSVVVFESMVLEYVNDPKAAWNEIQRISGGNYFRVGASPQTLTSSIYPGSKQTINEKTGEIKSVAMEKIVVLSLLGLFAYGALR
jgi:hypothetical protein